MAQSREINSKQDNTQSLNKHKQGDPAKSTSPLVLPEIVKQIFDTLSKLSMPTREINEMQKFGFILDSDAGKVKLNSFPVRNIEATSLDIVKLLGAEDANLIGRGNDFSLNKELNTKFGKVEIGINYRAEHNDIYITTVDTSTTGLSMRIILNEDQKPTSIVTIDDNINFFSTLFTYSQFERLAANLWPPIPGEFKQRLKSQEDYLRISEMIGKFTSDPSRQVFVSDNYEGKDGFFVNQATFKTESIDTPLATAGVATCAALIVIDKEKRQHYLAHIDAGVSIQAIRNSLKSFEPLEKKEIYFMEGTMPSGAIHNMLSAIIDNPEALAGIKFINPPPKTFNECLIYNGKILNPPDKVGDWEKAGNKF